MSNQHWRRCKSGPRWYESEGSETGSSCTGVSRSIFPAYRIEFFSITNFLSGAIDVIWPMYACSQSGPRSWPSRASRDVAPSETLLFILAPTRAASTPRGVDQHWQNASLILLSVWQIEPPALDLQTIPATALAYMHITYIVSASVALNRRLSCNQRQYFGKRRDHKYTVSLLGMAREYPPLV